MNNPNRRNLLVAAGAACTAGLAAVRIGKSTSRNELVDQRGAKSPVAVMKAGNYTVDLAQLIREGIAACGLQVKGKRVLLKPNHATRLGVADVVRHHCRPFYFSTLERA